MLYLDKIVIYNSTFYAYELLYVDLSLFEYRTLEICICNLRNIYPFLYFYGKQ